MEEQNETMNEDHRSFILCDDGIERNVQEPSILRRKLERLLRTEQFPTKKQEKVNISSKYFMN